jgi:hypothetical protein
VPAPQAMHAPPLANVPAAHCVGAAPVALAQP